MIYKFRVSQSSSIGGLALRRRARGLRRCETWLQKKEKLAKGWLHPPSVNEISSMTTWIPMLALPHIDVQEPIEVAGMAIVSLRDERLKTLTKKHRRFAMYMRRFKTEFGQQIWPSVLIRESTSPEQYRSVEALAGFRDALAVSVIPYSWAYALRFENTFGIISR